MLGFSTLCTAKGWQCPLLLSSLEKRNWNDWRFSLFWQQPVIEGTALCAIWPVPCSKDCIWIRSFPLGDKQATVNIITCVFFFDRFIHRPKAVIICKHLQGNNQDTSEELLPNPTCYSHSDILNSTHIPTEFLIFQEFEAWTNTSFSCTLLFVPCFYLFLSVPTLLPTLHVPTQWMSRTSPFLPPNPSLQCIFHQSFSFANWQMSSSSFCLPSPRASCLHKLKTSLRVGSSFHTRGVCIYLHSMTN